MGKTLIVMGNGPSLKDLNWDLIKDFDTFGLNSAYRAYERLDWYPTYHGCFDYIVTECHRQNFVKLINTGKIKQHFYIRNISNASNFTHINLQPWKTTDKINKSITQSEKKDYSSEKRAHHAILQNATCAVNIM